MFEKIKMIIGEQLGLAPDTLNSITMETNLSKDLWADSLDVVEILMSMEDEFDCEIPDEDAKNFKTIGDLVRYMENK